MFFSPCLCLPSYILDLNGNKCMLVITKVWQQRNKTLISVPRYWNMIINIENRENGFARINSLKC